MEYIKYLVDRLRLSSLISWCGAAIGANFFIV